MRLNRYLGLNVPEWMWIAFVAYTAFLAGSFSEWRSPSPGLGGFFGAVIVPLFLFSWALVGCGGGGAFKQLRLTEPDAGKTGIQGPLAVGAWLTPRVDVTIDGSGAPTLRLQTARPGDGLARHRDQVASL